MTPGVSKHLSNRIRAIQRNQVLEDQVLYRDEDYFENVKRGPSLPSLPVLQNIDTEVKTDTGIIDTDAMTAAVEETGETGPLVPCQVCGRSFAGERILKHVEVCEKTTAKHRSVYDVVRARVAGTEAEQLLAAGRLKLEPAKPMEKKSDLMKKYNLEEAKSTEDKHKGDKTKEKPQKVAQKKNGEAYQVVFDDTDKMRTRKPTTAIAPSKLPATVVRNGAKQDLRYLSASNWRKQRHQVSPDLNSSFSEEDIDFLASSMASQKTVCSDAFDFLFDEKNLNPEKVLEEEFNRSPSHLGVGVTKEKDPCCVIS